MSLALCLKHKAGADIGPAFERLPDIAMVRWRQQGLDDVLVGHQSGDDLLRFACLAMAQIAAPGHAASPDETVIRDPRMDPGPPSSRATDIGISGRRKCWPAQETAAGRKQESQHEDHHLNEHDAGPGRAIDVETDQRTDHA